MRLLNKKQKMLVSLVKESQRNDLKQNYSVSSFREASKGWRKELKEMGDYNIPRMQRVRDYLKHDHR